LITDSKDRVWCHPSNGTLKLFDQNTWHSFSIAGGRFTRGIHDDIWFVSNYSLMNYTDQIITKPIHVPESTYDLAVDSNESVWFATSKGIAMYDGYQVYGPNGFIFPKYSLQIKFDSHNDLWINQGYEKGVNVIDLNSFGSVKGKVYEPNEAPFEKATVSIYIDDGTELQSISDMDGSFYFPYVPQSDSINISSRGLSNNEVVLINKVISVTAKDTTLCDFKFSVLVTGIEESTPISFSLFPNYPNPFNPSTTIEFKLPSSGNASLIVYDIMGRKVRELVSGQVTAGLRSVLWDGRDDSGRSVSSGVYFARLTMGKSMAVKKMLLMK
jgi:hypothetical protein